MLELDFLRENFRWPNESQEPRRPAVGLLPELHRGRAEARAELIGLKRGEFAQRVHAPFVEDRDDAGNLRGAFGRGRLRAFLAAIGIFLRPFSLHARENRSKREYVQ